ncbi:(d)CMP kinase [uncultured Merdimonas sp.]|uniref:(d)CMP kinase n=1 Tax=uncultured Merdimonas sp. TaxID=2023269 RepID=UPI0032098077
MGFNVAIDGPAGAGKSTIAKLVAAEEGLVYVDTGAMYRGLAVYFLGLGISAEETDRLAAACREVTMEIGYAGSVQQVYVNGENITGRLREESVGNMASRCAAVPAVRECLLDLQRRLAKTQNVIMDGRDIGTCVLPQADLKIFLTASVETRARRRYLELKEKGVACDLEEIAADIRERDERDSTRKTAPLKQAADAVLIDSSDLSIEEVVAVIASLCREKRKTPN